MAGSLCGPINLRTDECAEWTMSARFENITIFTCDAFIKSDALDIGDWIDLAETIGYFCSATLAQSGVAATPSGLLLEPCSEIFFGVKILVHTIKVYVICREPAHAELYGQER